MKTKTKHKGCPVPKNGTGRYKSNVDSKFNSNVNSGRSKQRPYQVKSKTRATPSAKSRRDAGATKSFVVHGHAAGP